MKGIAEEAFRWFIKNWFATVAERQTVGRHTLTCLPGRHPRAVGRKGRGRERYKLVRLYGCYHWVHFRITVDQSPSKSGPGPYRTASPPKPTENTCCIEVNILSSEINAEIVRKAVWNKKVKILFLNYLCWNTQAYTCHYQPSCPC